MQRHSCMHVALQQRQTKTVFILNTAGETGSRPASGAESQGSKGDVEQSHERLRRCLAPTT